MLKSNDASKSVAPILDSLSWVVIVLASGRGERFKASGGTTHKLDAPLQLAGRTTTVLQATLDQARASGLYCHVERSPHATMGQSIAAAVQKNAQAEGWLILPGDMPLVPAAVITAVAFALAQGTHPIAAPVYQGRRGHPVGFAKTCKNHLLSLSDDEGARKLFQTYAVQTVSVDHLPRAEGCLIDVDTCADLQAVLSKES